MEDIEKTMLENTGDCWGGPAGAGEHQIDNQDNHNVEPMTHTDAKVMDAGAKTENCMVCGSTLKYLDQAEGLTCTYCGKIEQGYIKCPEDHFVCDTCHNKESVVAIQEIAAATTSKDPIEISELMMTHPGLPMLGCQHAYIATGALLAALKNEGTRKLTNADIDEAYRRVANQAIGGYCGLTGVCGITPAIGAVFAVLLGSKCGTDIEQKITMEAATRVSKVIADLTGPSCCKAYVRAALLVAVDILKERLSISLPVKDILVPCAYSDKHPHGCREHKCPYFGGNINEDVTGEAEIAETGVAHESDC